MKKMISVLVTLVLLLTVFVPLTVDSRILEVRAEERAALNISSPLKLNELYGWAAVHAEGLEGVTGGGSASPQLVTTFEELTRLAGDDIPRVLVVSGKIETIGPGIMIGSNKTIVGMDENATIYGGIRIHNASNVIVHNLNIQGTWPSTGPDDGVQVQNSHHLWFNHLSIWNAPDGNMDITQGSDYITVSWCKFWYTERAQYRHPHRLNALVSSGAGDHEDTDMGKLHITFHHNWFADWIKERMPRVMYGQVHLYNNYYSSQNNNYCIGADCYAALLVENNYFENVNNPHIFNYPDNDYPASITARGNMYNRTKGSRAAGQKNSLRVVPYETTNYDYYLDLAADVPRIVQSYVGPCASSVQAPAKGTYVKAVEKEHVKIVPAPLPSSAPASKKNDNPITYREEDDTYTYHGQNSDGSNAYYEIENPFAGKDYSEEQNAGQVPYWEKGATIAYWVKMPQDYSIHDAAVLNFNLENDRQIERSDLAKYKLCKAYSSMDSSYSMGARVTYIDARGRSFDVLEGYGKNVCYNPNYPAEGCYRTSYDGGAYYAYRQGTDPANPLNWKYLNYIGEGMYSNYSARYFEKGGVNSKIREADISGSFSLYASGSMGFRQDNWTGIQRNPYLETYGDTTAMHIFNQYFYWTNGSDYMFWGDKTTDFMPGMVPPGLDERDQWHYMVAVIQNDWVQYYMDGLELSSEYLNYFGEKFDVRAAGESFNLGFGHNRNYRNRPAPLRQTSRSLLEFISDDRTTLTVGGVGLGAEKIGQGTIGTPNGVQVKGLEFYYIPVRAECILADRIDLDRAYLKQEDAPDKTKEEDHTIPEIVYAPGDVNGDERIELEDVAMTLKVALHITEFPAPFQKNAADVSKDGNVTLKDAQMILRKVLKITTDFDENLQ